MTVRGFLRKRFSGVLWIAPELHSFFLRPAISERRYEEVKGSMGDPSCSVDGEPHGRSDYRGQWGELVRTTRRWPWLWGVPAVKRCREQLMLRDGWVPRLGAAICIAFGAALCVAAGFICHQETPGRALLCGSLGVVIMIWGGYVLARSNSVHSAALSPFLHLTCGTILHQVTRLIPKNKVRAELALAEETARQKWLEMPQLLFWF